MNKPLHDDLIAEIDKLKFDDQMRVLSYARALSSAKPRGKPGVGLKKYAGSISKEDLSQMRAVIKQDCEQVDHDGW